MTYRVGHTDRVAQGDRDRADQGKQSGEGIRENPSGEKNKEGEKPIGEINPRGRKREEE